MSKSMELPDCSYPMPPITITPCAPTPKHSILLSNLDDQMYIRMFVSYVYLFKKSVGLDILKSSLTRVLVDYYPLAGRLRTSNEDENKLEVDCNGEGVAFSEALMDTTAEELLKYSMIPNESWEKLMCEVEDDGFSPVPPLIIQVFTLLATMSRGFQVRATSVTILAHLLFIAITSLLLVWLLHFREGVALYSSNKIKIFNLHPLLMVIGFILVGGEAIMTYKYIPGKRSSAKVVHLLLHLIALAAGVFGIVAVFKSKKEAGFPNMYTLHSWLGMSAICAFGLQYILAFFAYFFPGAEMSTRATLLPWHRFIGMVIFLLAVGTAETGLVEYFQFLGLFRNQEALIVNFTGLLLFLFAVVVSLSVILPRNY